VPVAALTDRRYTEEDYQDAVRAIERAMARNAFPYPLDQDVANLRTELDSIREASIWAPSSVIWDAPVGRSESARPVATYRALIEELDHVESEVLVETAYLVLWDSGIDELHKLTERGVHVRILTNSLASNDVIAAHAGHAKYREAYLRSGAELYEFRPDAGAIDQSAFASQSTASLHSKAIVFDRKSVFIGSFNLDPRSARINTEAGLYVESPQLAEQVIAFMDEGIQPENSYRVVLDRDGNLSWITQTDGQEVRYDSEPETTFGQRFMASFIMLLPIEDQF
jgi:putative cardiolipin synthase